MKDVTAIILGGGRGTRLFPLTLERSKPAVAFAGKYRLIDIPLSNCINSGLKKVFVLTQFLSASMHRHIMQDLQLRHLHRRLRRHPGRRADPRAPRLVPGHQRRGAGDPATTPCTTRRSRCSSCRVTISTAWTTRSWCDFHRESGADITLGVYPVARGEAPRMGLLRADGDGRGDRVRGEAPGPGGDRPLPRAARAVRRPRPGDRRRTSTWLHGHLRVRARRAARGAGGRASKTDFGKRGHPRRHRRAQGHGLPVHRLLARHRDHRLVLRGQPRAGPARAGLRPAPGRLAVLHPHALAAAQPHRRLGDPRQPGGRGLGHHRRARSRTRSSACAAASARARC